MAMVLDRLARLLPLGAAMGAVFLYGTGCPVEDPSGDDDDDSSTGDDDTTPGDDDDDSGCVAINGQPGYFYIQEAITAAVDGDVITLCGRTFLESVVIDKAITLKRSGTTQPVIQGIGGEPGISIRGVSQVMVEGLAVEGDDEAVQVQDSTSVQLTNLSLNVGKPRGMSISGSSVTIADMEFTGLTEAGLDLDGGAEVTLTNSAFRQTGAYGIRGTASSLTLDNVSFAGIVRPDGGEESEGSAIYLTSPSAPIVINGGSFTDGSRGVVVEGGDLTVTGAVFARMEHGVVNYPGATSTAVSDTSFDTCREVALTFDGAADISENTFSVAEGAATALGIWGMTTSGTAHVEGNSFLGLGAGAIFLDGTTSAAGEVLNNNIQACGAFGIWVHGLGTVAVSGGEITDIDWLEFGDPQSAADGAGIVLDTVSDGTLSEVTINAAQGMGVVLMDSVADLDEIVVVASGTGGVGVDAGSTANITNLDVAGGFGRGVLADGGMVMASGLSIQGTTPRTDPLDPDVYLSGAAVEGWNGAILHIMDSDLGGNTAGVWAMDSMVEVSGCTIDGASQAAIWASSTDPEASMTVSDTTADTGNDGIVVTGGSVDLTQISLSNLGREGVHLMDVDSTSIIGIEITDCGASGVMIDGAAQATLEEVAVHDSVGIGVSVAASANVDATAVVVMNAVDYGIRVQDSSNVTLTNCSASTVSGSGASVGNSTTVSIIGSSFVDSTGDGVSLNQSEVSITGASDASDNLGTGIRVAGGSLLLNASTTTGNVGEGVRGNGEAILEVVGSTLSGNMGLGLRAEGCMVSVRDGEVEDNGGGGLAFDGGDLFIDGNAGVSNNTGMGISLAGEVTGDITDNDITGNDGYGITCVGPEVALSSCSNTMSGNGMGNFGSSGGCVLTCTAL